MRLELALSLLFITMSESCLALSGLVAAALRCDDITVTPFQQQLVSSRIQHGFNEGWSNVLQVLC